MSEAGIPRTRPRAYLGHAAHEDVTDRYEGYAPDEYLDEDRRRLRAFMGARARANSRSIIRVRRAFFTNA